MDFTPTEAQQDLAGLTRGIVTDLVTADRLRELDNAEDRFDRALWTALAVAGVLAAALPESVGGDGFGVLEQCAILRRTRPRRRAGAVPVVDRDGGRRDRRGSATEQQRPTGRAPAARGETILTVALDEELDDTPGRPSRVPNAARTAGPSTAPRSCVDAAPSADLILVPATTPDGAAVFLVAPDDAGVTVTRQQIVDLARHRLRSTSTECRWPTTACSAPSTRAARSCDWLRRRAASLGAVRAPARRPRAAPSS